MEKEDRRRGTGKRKPGVWQLLKRVYIEQGNDNLFVVSAGVAFYALLAIFPGLTALISIYGLAFDPAQVQQQFTIMRDIMPEAAYQIIYSQITDIVSQPSGSLTFGLAGGLLLTLWSAARGMKALIIALNIAYNTRESRSILRFNFLAIFLTFGAVLFVIVSLVLIVVLPALMGYIDFLARYGIVILLVRWVLLAVFIMFGLSLIYRYAPDRENPKWKCVNGGAILATIIWIFGSILFSWYVANFNSYNETYGSMGAFIILLVWFYLTSYLILLGAELNVELECGEEC